MSYDADELLGRMRGDAESDWPYRLLRRIADVPGSDGGETLEGSSVRWTRRTNLPPGVARVLQAASFGLTNEMIADALGVTLETVKSQLQRGILMLGAKNRTHACCIALRRGLIT